MRRFFYLFLFFIFIPFVSAAPSFDQNIYVNPFIFGSIKGSDGQILNISVQDFPQGESKFRSGMSDFEIENSLSLVEIRDHLFIFNLYQDQLYFFNKTNKNPLKLFHIKFSNSEYPDSNIYALFKLYR